MWDKRGFQISILLLLAFVWGSSFILIKIGLKSFTSEQAAAIRMLLASLFLLPVSYRNLKHLQKKDLGYLLIVGFVGSFIPAFLFTKAQTHIDSALAGMLNSLTPVFTLLIGLIVFKLRFLKKQVIGLFLGLVGAVGLIIAGEDISFRNVNAYALLVILATTMYATNINIVKAKLYHLNGIQITSLSFMFLWPVALIMMFTMDFSPALQNPDWPLHFAALAILGIVGTAAAMLLMNSMIRRVSTIFASSVTYIIPIFAILWGVVDGELITMHHLGSMAIVLLGVYLISRKK